MIRMYNNLKRSQLRVHSRSILSIVLRILKIRKNINNDTEREREREELLRRGRKKEKTKKGKKKKSFSPSFVTRSDHKLLIILNVRSCINRNDVSGKIPIIKRETEEKISCVIRIRIHTNVLA